MKEKKNQKIRVDELLLTKGLASTLNEAKALIYSGKIHTTDRKILKPSEKLEATVFLGVKDSSKNKNFVSRGGLKLESALNALNNPISFQNKTVLDIGASTGGFTDYALQQGASKVIALDVGTNQLTWKLRNHSQVISLEKTHIKDFKRDEHPICKVIVADISFNSLAKLAPFIAAASTFSELELFLLVKPQFELPRELVPQGGVVIEEEHRDQALNIVIEAFAKENLGLVSKTESPVKGKTGNQEIFIYLKREKN